MLQRGNMRKTKIVATIGPASNNCETLKNMVLAGLNVVRINLSHAKIKDMEQTVKIVKRLRKELKVPLPIMIDTRGPEIRVKTFKDGQAQIKKGQRFIFTARDVEGDDTQVSFNHPCIVKCIKPGDRILAVNGLLVFKVLEVTDKDVITKAQNAGVLGNRKSLSIPGIKFNTPYLNEQDKDDIIWAIKNDVDIIAASFVNSKQDIMVLKKYITDNGGDMRIIAKIESIRGLDNLDEIIAAADGTMVARGDLGVEVPVEKLPAYQKLIIDKTKMAGKAVITATEMLESMITNNRPTRAEVSDVANAVYDGTSAVMLSGESAMGKFPVEAVATMAKVAQEAEKNIDYHERFQNISYKLENTTDVISHSAVDASFMKGTKAIVAFTTRGMSARMVSRFRPSATIVGATPNEKTYRQLDMYWGIQPILTPLYNSADEMFEIAHKLVTANKIAKAKDKIVITCGVPKQNGCTNLIKIDQVR